MSIKLIFLLFKSFSLFFLNFIIQGEKKWKREKKPFGLETPY